MKLLLRKNGLAVNALTVAHPHIQTQPVAGSSLSLPLVSTKNSNSEQDVTKDGTCDSGITYQWLMLVQHQHKLSQRPILPRLLSRHPRALWATRARRLCRSHRARLAHRVKTRAARGSRRSRSRVRRLRRRRCLHRSLRLRQACD